MNAERRTIWIWAIVAIVAIGVAAIFDAPTARWARDCGLSDFLQSHKLIREILKSPGYFPTTLAIAIIVALIHRAKWRAAIFVLLAGSTAGLNLPVKYLVGRTRPYKLEELKDSLEPMVFHPLRFANNLCFPSGHATLAFATAAALGMLWPRGRWAFYLLATCVAAERVLEETAHWLSDAVAGAALGIAGAYLVAWLLTSWMNRPAISRS